MSAGSAPVACPSRVRRTALAVMKRRAASGTRKRSARSSSRESRRRRSAASSRLLTASDARHRWISPGGIVRFSHSEEWYYLRCTWAVSRRHTGVSIPILPSLLPESAPSEDDCARTMYSSEGRGIATSFGDGTSGERDTYSNALAGARRAPRRTVASEWPMAGLSVRPSATDRCLRRVPGSCHLQHCWPGRSSRRAVQCIQQC